MRTEGFFDYLFMASVSSSLGPSLGSVLLNQVLNGFGYVSIPVVSLRSGALLATSVISVSSA